MGRIKTARIKRVANIILKKFEDLFTTDVEKNKQAMSEVVEIPSKKVRNIVAGYITRLKKQKIIEEKMLRGEIPMKKRSTRSEEEKSPRNRRSSFRRDRQER
jgi:small subunit ribosomal protein S17e